MWPKTNEAFVADGYGNRRVIVFDADTGAFKRQWGAFSNTPIDVPAAPRGGGGGTRRTNAGAETLPAAVAPRRPSTPTARDRRSSAGRCTP